MASATRRFHIIGSVEVGRCFLVGNLIKRRDIGVGAGFKCGGGMVDVTTVDWQTAEKHANPPRSNSQRRIAMQEKGRDVFVCFEELPKRPGLSWVSIQTSNLWLELLALGPFHSCLVFKS